MASTTRRPRSAPLVISLLALVVALVWTPVGQGVASGLTTGAVKKIAKKVARKEIRKQAPGLTVGRASDADRLGGVPASGYAHRGTFEISLGPSTWVPFSATEVVARSQNAATVAVAGAGNHFYTIDFTAPIAADGVQLRLTKIRYCFGASPTVRLTDEAMSVFKYTAGVGTQVGSTVSHLINVQAPGCRVYGTDLVLGPQDNATFFVTFNTTGAASIVLGAVTAQFEPTDQPFDPVS